MGDRAALTDSGRSGRVGSLRVPTPTFTQVYQSHAPMAWRSLRRLGVPDAEVADAAQEVFVVVHRKLDGFEGRSSLTTWLTGICLRVAPIGGGSTVVR